MTWSLRFSRLRCHLWEILRCPALTVYCCWRVCSIFQNFAWKTSKSNFEVLRQTANAKKCFSQVFCKLKYESVPNWYIFCKLFWGPHSWSCYILNGITHWKWSSVWWGWSIYWEIESLEEIHIWLIILLSGSEKRCWLFESNASQVWKLTLNVHFWGILKILRAFLLWLDSLILPLSLSCIPTLLLLAAVSDALPRIDLFQGFYMLESGQFYHLSELLWSELVCFKLTKELFVCP